MRIFLMKCVRPLGLALVGLTVLAVVLGRSVPADSGFRRVEGVRYHPINWYLFRADHSVPRFLDAETGKIVVLGRTGAGHLDNASCSPWRDERGEVQLVGLWNEATEQGRSAGALGMGLARYTFPDWRVIDRLPTEVIPASAPCWQPGTAPMVLFTATDGRLYRLVYPGSGSQERVGPSDPAPLAHVPWQCPQPGVGEPWMSDPAWPAVAPLRGKVLVSLRIGQQGGPDRVFSRASIWWLRLSRDGSAIEEAGPLTDPDPRAEQHWPALAAQPDGSLTLAFLSRREGAPSWTLGLAPVAVDSETGIPRAGKPITVPEGLACLPSPPVFSPDGQWVHSLSHLDPRPVSVRRLRVQAVLAARPSPEPGPVRLAEADPADESPGAGSACVEPSTR